MYHELVEGAQEFYLANAEASLRQTVQLHYCGAYSVQTSHFHPDTRDLFRKESHRQTGHAFLSQPVSSCPLVALLSSFSEMNGLLRELTV